jgi:hypothetical protein
MVWNPSQDYTATWQGILLTASKKNGNRRADSGSK